jgi:hypothetical protein
MMTWSGHILEFESTGPWREPAFAGPMLRGAFGYALKRLVCAMRLRDCDGCPLEHACIYTTLFETRPTPGSGLMTRYDRAPHPFVLVIDSPIEGPREGAAFAPARLQVGLRLFGEAVRAAPFALRALEEAGARGFGPSRTPFRLLGVAEEGEAAAPSYDGAWPPARVRPAPPPAAARTRLRFLTPLRLKRENRLVTADALTGPDLAMQAVRRLGLIASFFAGGAQGMDFPALKRAAQTARLTDARLVWRDLTRHSSRQNTRLGVGGLIGEATLEIGDDPGLAAAIGWAATLHIGKGASMGLGRVTLDAAA